jgi:ribosomal protein S18 acetylase RimI-like enzyme
MEIRAIRPDEYGALGEITVRAYRALFAGGPLGPYEHQLFDVARRAKDSEVFVALDDAGTLLGGVTYVPGPERDMSEFSDPDAAGIRMLAVDPSAQRTGAGRALVETCLQRARDQGRRRVILHSTPAMTVAQGIYRRLGFERAAELDQWVTEGSGADGGALQLMAFTLSL